MADLNYFVCTLGQAAEFNQYKGNTVNEFLDHQAQTHPLHLAVGFPIPSQEKRHWDSVVYCRQHSRILNSSRELTCVISFQGSKANVALIRISFQPDLPGKTDRKDYRLLVFEFGGILIWLAGVNEMRLLCAFDCVR